MIHEFNKKCSGKSDMQIKIKLLKAYINSDQEAIKLYKMICLFKGVSFFDLWKISMTADLICKYKRRYQRNKLMLTADSYKYDEILTKMVDLAKELKLDSTIEYCNLYTYLLWNGYLSKDNSLTYDIKNTLKLEGGLFLDVMSGTGICINYSGCLSDFLNKAGYQSICLNNTYKMVEANYKIPLERSINKNFLDDYVLKFIQKTLLSKIDNHCFTLVKDKNKYYIYDPTTLNVFKIDNTKKASLICGTGSVRINVFSSFMNIITDQDEKILNDLIFNKMSSCYTEDDVRFITGKDMELFNDHRNLLNDFHNDIKSDIDFIVHTYTKLKLRK